MSRDCASVRGEPCDCGYAHSKAPEPTRVPLAEVIAIIEQIRDGWPMMNLDDEPCVEDQIIARLREAFAAPTRETE